MYSQSDPRQRYSEAGAGGARSSRFDEPGPSKAGRQGIGSESVMKDQFLESSSNRYAERSPAASTRSRRPPAPPEISSSKKRRKSRDKNSDYGPVSKKEVEACMDVIFAKMQSRSKIASEEKSDFREVDLEGLNPSIDDIPNVLLDYRKSGDEVFVGARFIFEIGIKLDVKPTTIAVATCLFHKFWSKAEAKNYDICTIGGTSMYLATKIENEKKKVRDLVNVIHHSINREADVLDMNETYFMYKNGLTQCELLMMRVLQFQITFDLPHRYLVHYLRALQFWKGFHMLAEVHPGFMKTAWSLLQDFYHDPACILYEPQELAIAAIDIAVDVFGIDLSSDSKKSALSWKKVFYGDFNEKAHVMIKTKMLDVYEKEKEIVKKYRYIDPSVPARQPREPRKEPLVEPAGPPKAPPPPTIRPRRL